MEARGVGSPEVKGDCELGTELKCFARAVCALNF